jgi:hypothetical protein
MQIVLGLLSPVASVAVVLQGSRKRVMPEVIDCAFRVKPLVIGMALDTGVTRKTTVKKSLDAPDRQHPASDVPDADISRFVATDALHGGTSERLMTAQAIVFKFLMSFHE